MREIIYDVAVTLDGLIAAPGDDISAFPAEGDHVEAYRARLATYATVIMGRRTYEAGYRFGLKPGARAYPHMDHHVFSRRIELPEESEVTVVRDNWRAALEALRAAPGGPIYLCGGMQFATWVAREGLLDRLRLKIAPVALGTGLPLFTGLPAPLRFERTAVTPHASGVILAEYRVLR
jgi:dihydrofolate reductase